MRNKLLKSTMLVGALSIPLSAQSLDINVGGFANFQAAFSSNDSLFETGSFSRDLKFSNNTEIHVNVSGESDKGLKYGTTIELEADVSADAHGEGLNADKTFIWLETSAGRVELGNNEGAESTMGINAGSIARATGGVDGDNEFYQNISGVGSPAFVIHPSLPTADTGGIKEDATKLTYYSPNLSGAQLGVSFTPDEGNGGTAAGFTSDTNGDFENVFGLGLTYGTKSGDLDIGLSLAGEFGDAENAGTEDLSAWTVGASLGYQGFSVAGSYADWNDSGKATGSNQDASNWSLGAAYENGNYGVSLTYLESENANDDFTNYVFSADYTIAPGLTSYAEVSFFEADENGAVVDNDGSVVIVGTSLAF